MDSNYHLVASIGHEQILALLHNMLGIAVPGIMVDLLTALSIHLPINIEGPMIPIHGKIVRLHYLSSSKHVAYLFLNLQPLGMIWVSMQIAKAAHC